MLKQPQNKYTAFAPIQMSERLWPSQQITQAPIWLSTDLRDGNQALMEPMNIETKLAFFDLLVEIGFKQIEVGFPAASQIEYDFIRRLIDEKRIPDDVTIGVLTQARAPLIERTIASLQGAPKAIVHIYNPTAPVFRDVVYQKNQQEIIQIAVKATELLKAQIEKHPETQWIYQYSPEAFSMTELPFAKEICDAVVNAWGAKENEKIILNLPATVEASSPNVYADQVEWMHRNLERREAIILSVHPHNDRGCAVAAAELALMAGADRVEGCVFGNGERTGNVDIVTLAMNMYTQGISPELDFSNMDWIMSSVQEYTKLPVHPRHPYAGELVFTSFSGSHQDAIRKAFCARAEKANAIWDMPYLPLDPKDIGRNYDAVIRVNSQSGKGGVSFMLEHYYGLILPRMLQIELSALVQPIAESLGKALSEQQIYAIFSKEYLYDEKKHISNISEDEYFVLSTSQNSIANQAENCFCVIEIKSKDGQNTAFGAALAANQETAYSRALKTACFRLERKQVTLGQEQNVLQCA